MQNVCFADVLWEHGILTGLLQAADSSARRCIWEHEESVVAAVRIVNPSDMVQVIGEWVESKTLDEVLAAMKEARVPSGTSIHHRKLPAPADAACVEL